ncbi:type II secretion system protein GspG [Verrucomicrobiaceae bacterium 227]
MKIQTTNNNRPLRRMARGFSLFEMVIVMGIIGLILGGAIFSMGKIKNSAEISTCDQSLGSLATNLENYKNIGGHYPSQSQGLEALITKPSTAPRPRRWTQTLDSDKSLYDPWGTKLEYHYPGKQDPTRPEIISAGPDKVFGGEDDQSSQDGK